jgi:hypothetical protein
MVIIKLFSCDLKIILLFYIYSSTKSILLTGNTTRAVLVTGADPGFQVREGALKKIAPSGGSREKIWGISCEKSRFYDKKSYFFQLRAEGGAKIFGVFRVKNHDFTPKNHIFTNFRGARAGCAPAWIRP